jgi:glutamate formiminotransferase
VSRAYAIDDGEGNQITAGLSEYVARTTAQRIATERGISVYLYETPAKLDEDGDAIDESEEFTP